MRARDVMTTEVVTAHPDAPVQALAKLMAEYHIGGLPVVDGARRLAGIVTGGDLYRRADLGTGKRHSHWLDMFDIDSRQAINYVEAHGHIARDVMTTNVIAVAPMTTLRQIADLFETKRIRRVPVLDAGVLVGIVSRANLVQALAVTVRDNTRGRQRDHHMRDRVLAKFSRLPWGIPSEGNVIVTAGVVHVWGYLPSSAEVDVLRVVAEGIRGVKGFQDHTYRYFGDVSVRNHTRSEVTLVGPVVTRPTNTDITSCAGSAQRPFRS
jgi:CBS domain-containing protein